MAAQENTGPLSREDLLRVKALELAVTNGSAARLNDFTGIADRFYTWLVAVPETQQKAKGSRKSKSKEPSAEEKSLAPASGELV